jgi:hypothetical protein
MHRRLRQHTINRSSGRAPFPPCWVPGLKALAGVKVLVTDEWGLFLEGKYNLASVSNFDQTFGLSGAYSVFHAVAGVAYHC